MIEIRCESCGYRFGAEDGLAGLAVECPHCGADVLVPSLRDVEVPLDEKAPPPVRYHTVADERKKPDPQPQEKPKKKRPKKE